jgi:hypothetical protein
VKLYAIETQTPRDRFVSFSFSGIRAADGTSRISLRNCSLSALFSLLLNPVNTLSMSRIADKLAVIDLFRNPISFCIREVSLCLSTNPVPASVRCLGKLLVGMTS